MLDKPSDELKLKMVEEVRAYYLIRGSAVRVLQGATATPTESPTPTPGQ